MLVVVLSKTEAEPFRMMTPLFLIPAPSFSDVFALTEDEPLMTRTAPCRKIPPPVLPLTEDEPFIVNVL